MKLEDQVTSLDLSNKLKELGVKQEGVFVWTEKVWLGGRSGEPFVAQNSEYYNDAEYENLCIAFTVAELGEMLPKELYVPYKGNSGKKRKYPQHPHFFFMNSALVNYTGGNSQERLTQKGDTEANARGKMLIYLLENKFITL